jgi:hypothetical protein
MDILSRNPSSDLYEHYTNEVHSKLSELLGEVVEELRKNYNKKRKIMEPSKTGELLMLNGHNIRARHQYKKREDEMIRPFEMMLIGSNL